MSDIKKTIASVISEVLEKNKRLLSIEELHDYINNENLYEFKDGVDSKHIIATVLKRKCINTNLSYKNKESVFFYDYESNKYGLLSWLTQEQQQNFVEQVKQQKSVNIEENIEEEHTDKVTGLQIISILSVAWVLFIIIFFFNDGGMKLDLNAMGDYLAGFFTPVLFLWLVYGVSLQKEEFAKVVESFKLQQKEVADSVKTMKDQVVQVEVQHLHTWFNRNIRMIENIKLSMFRNNRVIGIDSIALINKSLQENIDTEKDYFNTFDELKNILDLVLYMKDYLQNLEDSNLENKILLKSVQELQEEYNMLMQEEIQNIKEIMCLVYIFIECRKDSKYKKYELYMHWVEQNEDIINLLVSQDGATITDKLQAIVENIPQISKRMNFDKSKSGAIDGSI